MILPTKLLIREKWTHYFFFHNLANISGTEYKEGGFMKERDGDVWMVAHRWIKKMCTETTERMHTIGCKRLHTYNNNVERERELGRRERVSDRERNVYPHAHMHSWTGDVFASLNEWCTIKAPEVHEGLHFVLFYFLLKLVPAPFLSLPLFPLRIIAQISQSVLFFLEL